MTQSTHLPISILLDFETLSTDPSAIVTEIGCIAVHRESATIIDHLDLRPNILTQLADGRSHDRDTILWATKKGTLPDHLGAIEPKPAALELINFIARHKIFRIWAWGKDFERPLLENLCRHYRIETPAYQFRTFTCARDQWQSAYGMDSRPAERSHHAHEDCLAELSDLRQALTAMSLIHTF